MKNYLLLTVFGFSLLGCAGAAIKKEFLEKRGYSQEDIKEIETQRQPYVDILAKGRVASNAFNTTEKVAAEGRVKAVFCSCYKKLGEKCTQKADGLSKDDHVLWVKSNAAEMALAGMSANDNPFDSQGYRLDTAECN